MTLLDDLHLLFYYLTFLETQNKTISYVNLQHTKIFTEHGKRRDRTWRVVKIAGQNISIHLDCFSQLLQFQKLTKYDQCTHTQLHMCTPNSPPPTHSPQTEQFTYFLISFNS